MNFTQVIDDDYRPRSGAANKSLWNKIIHKLFGCWHLESMRHATVYECLYCFKDSRKKNSWPYHKALNGSEEKDESN